MLNTVVLIGRLTRDPDLRYTSQGTAVTNFGIAVDRGYKTQGDQQTADFFNVICWNRLAEIVAQYTVKGRLVAVQGRLQSSTVDRDGKRRTYIEIVANTVRFLERGTDSNQPPTFSDDQNKSSFEQMNFKVEDDDDLPF